MIAIAEPAEGAPSVRRSELSTVHAALAGDHAAQMQLMSGLAPLSHVLHACLARSGRCLRSHDVEDVVQATLLAVWSKLRQFDGRASLLQWAVGFGKLELRKAVCARRRVPLQWAGGEPAADQPVPCAIDRETLTLQLAELPAVERSALTMKVLEELTFVEASERLGESAGTVKTSYYRALSRLRARCDPHRHC